MWAFNRTQGLIIICLTIASGGLVHAIGLFSFWKNNASGATSFIWTGNTGDNKWSTTGNWSGNQVPAATDLAEFRGANCSGANCNVNVDVNAAALGVSMSSAYTGTITQGSGITITVGTSGWVQSTGSFIGSDTDLTVSGAFTLSGGTFTPPAANFKLIAKSGVGYTVFNQSGGTYNSGSGTLFLAMASPGCTGGQTYTIDVATSLTVNHLRYAGGHSSSANNCTWAIAAGDSLTVNGNFTIQRDLAAGTLSSSGTVNAMGNLTYGTGTNGGALIVNINGTGNQTVIQASGAVLPSGVLTINKASGIAYWGSNITFNNSPLTVQTVLDTNNFTTNGSNLFTIGSAAKIRERIVTQTNANGWNILTGSTWEFYGTPSMTLIVNGFVSNYIMNKGSGNNITLVGDSSVLGNVEIPGDFRTNGYAFTVGGNWIKTGSYTPGTSTVILNGTNQSISGNNTFYNLTKSVTAARTLTFEAGSTTTISNTLTLTGSSGATKLSLRSTTPGTQWSINAQGTRTLGYLDVQDSNNTNVTAMAGTATSVDSGNNINWTFGNAINWTGLAGDNKWSTSGNWAGNVVPGVGNVARFIGSACSGSNCNVNVDINADVEGIDMSSSYTGTITQGTGITMVVGPSGWVQSTGTFVGSDADLTLNGAFNLSGGTFTPPSTNFKVVGASGISSTVFTQSGGTYNPGTGTLFFAITSPGCTGGQTYTIDVATSLTVNHLRYAGGHNSSANNCTWAVAAGDTLIANGNFAMQRDRAAGTMQASGTVNVKGDVTYSTGSAGGSMALSFAGTGNQNFSQTGGVSLPTGNLTVNKASGSVLQTTAITLANSNFYLTSGTYDLQGFGFSGIGQYYHSANALIRMHYVNLLSAAGWNQSSGCIWEYYGPTSFSVYWTGATCHQIWGKNAGYSITLVNPGLSASGDFTASGSGTLNFASQPVSVGGNWSRQSSATVSFGTTTLVLNGTNQTIYGSTAFYGLTKSVTTARTLTFEAGTTTTVTNAVTLTGSSAAARLSLRSTTSGSQWSINAQGTRTINFLDVKDSNNTNGTAMAATDASIDSGNNTNWTFASATADKKIFLTSTTQNGNFGGVSGADSVCAARATAGGLSGTFKAWIAVTSGTDDPATTFVHSAVPYKMRDGTTVANDWAGLTSGSILAQINIDESGNTVAGTERRATNVATDGSASFSGSNNSNNCAGWTNGTGGRSARYGSSGATDSTWTDNGATTAACNQSYRLICVQQY